MRNGHSVEFLGCLRALSFLVSLENLSPLYLQVAVETRLNPSPDRGAFCVPGVPWPYSCRPFFCVLSH
jgi:hypothetical protein